MNEESAFLSAILAAPDDDTARLAFADWLDEHDDPRGEFLRAAVTLRTSTLTDEEVAERRRRILELRPSVPSSWLVSVLRDYAEDDVREAVFRKAFGDGRNGTGAYLLVENGGDPSWYLFARLAADYPGIESGSAAETRDGFYRSKGGSRGCMYSVAGLEWRGLDRCDVEFGVVIGPLMGHGTRHRVELQDERWAVTHSEGTWIS